MPPPPERRWPGVVAGYTLFLGLVALAATPLYLFATSANKPVVLRVVAAVVIGVALIHLRRIVWERFEEQRVSAFERALVPVAVEPELAPLFVTLEDEIRFGAKSRSYFDHVLWPRILAVAVRPAGPAAASALAKPVGRFFRRGPSPATLAKVIAEIEEGT